MDLPDKVFFAGAVWGCGYYVGTIKSFQQQYGDNIGKHIAIYGDSAGAMIGQP
jgi:hypothetical protein